MLAFCVMLLLCTNSNGQSDSALVCNTKWHTKRIAPGIELKQYRFENSLFESSQNINILEIKLNRKNRIDVAAEPAVLKPTSVFGATAGALAALNGTFFDMAGGGSVDYIRVDGQAVNESRISAQHGRLLHQKAAIVIDGRKVGMAVWDGSSDWEQRLKGEDVMVSGPLLVSDGQRTGFDNGDRMRHPRTAVAIRAGKLLLITVDGRSEQAAGMNFIELASFLKWIGAEEGINLDGGGSTTLWIDGFSESGIVNHPSDRTKEGQKESFKERPVANVLLVTRKKQNH